MPPSRVAVGVGRAVAPLQPDLVRQLAFWPVDEEFWIEGDAAVRVGVELHHPAVKTVLVELAVDGAVKRVGEIDPAAIAADLDHLRPAPDLAVLGAGMPGAGDDAADAHLPGEFWVKRVGDVILLEVAGSPARHVEKAV